MLLNDSKVLEYDKLSGSIGLDISPVVYIGQI